MNIHDFTFKDGNSREEINIVETLDRYLIEYGDLIINVNSYVSYTTIVIYSNEENNLPILLKKLWIDDVVYATDFQFEIIHLKDKRKRLLTIDKFLDII